jgi:hypothetical protein
MYVYYVYPAMSKRTNQLPNYLERAETNVVLIVFNGDLYRVRAYIVVVSYRRST